MCDIVPTCEITRRMY